MQRFIALAVIGGVGYWLWTRAGVTATAFSTETVAQKYAKPIGPGLEGFTNVGKINVIEHNGGRITPRWNMTDAPMGYFAKSNW